MPIKIKDEAEFRALMERVDRELREQNAPIPTRQFEAMRVMRRLLETDEEFVLPRYRIPRPGRYEGGDLFLRVLKWIGQRYGDRLAIRLPEALTLIRGDPYRLRLPFSFGVITVICDPRLMGAGGGVQIAQQGADRPVINALDMIVDLTPHFAESLTPDDCRAVCTDFETGICYVRAILSLNARSAMIDQAVNDLASSVDCALRANPDFGGSRWHSLQAVEKFLKSILSLKGINYPKAARGHDIPTLAGLAKPFVAVDEAFVAAVNCDARVRYGEVTSTLSQAHAAHQAALKISTIVVRAIVKG